VLRQFVSSLTPKKLCLIADRSHAIRHAAASILRDLGFQTAEAESEGEAIVKYWQCAPSAVLIDGALASQDRFAFLQQLAEGNGTHAPKIILCTNTPDPAQIVGAIGAGADEYVVKPFDRSVLATKFEQLGLMA